MNIIPIIPFDTVENIFWNIRKHIPKSAIMYILMKQQEYYEKAEENVINDTAFLTVLQYVCREIEHTEISVSKHTIRLILDTEKDLLTQKHKESFIQPWQSLN